MLGVIGQATPGCISYVAQLGLSPSAKPVDHIHLAKLDRLVLVKMNGCFVDCYQPEGSCISYYHSVFQIEFKARRINTHADSRQTRIIFIDVLSSFITRLIFEQIRIKAPVEKEVKND